MWPLAGLAFGAVVGALGVPLRGSQIAEHARPAAKAALKAALAAAHELHLRQVEAAEAAEDLFAEAEAEVAVERQASAGAAVAKEGAAVNEEDLRQPHIIEAVQELYKLYFETNGNVMPEKVARIIATAHAKANAATATAETRQSPSREFP
jgi:hypothetical protein